MTLAQRMLEKMGWKEGEGLGRNRQGISAPLVAQKTAQHAAVIVQAPEPEPKRPKVQGATFSGPPTKVVVLRNMVGPGEVDEALEEEVRRRGGGGGVGAGGGPVGSGAGTWEQVLQYCCGQVRCKYGGLA
jgi:hypothetical protein